MKTVGVLIISLILIEGKPGSKIENIHALFRLVLLKYIAGEYKSICVSIYLKGQNHITNENLHGKIWQRCKKCQFV